MGHIAFEAHKTRNTDLRRRAEAARLAALARPERAEPRPERTRRSALLLRTLRPSRAA